MKKKISWDVWGTLIKSNPLFKQKQYKLAKELFSISEEDFNNGYKKAKDVTNHAAENFGIHYNREFLLKEIFGDYDFSEYICDSNELFLKYPPIILHDISDIVEKHDCYITSNTVFIYGDILGQVIEKYFGIPLDRMIFSDQIGVSKPHTAIFEAHKIKFDYHVGDNIITDGSCTQLNINFINIINLKDAKI